MNQENFFARISPLFDVGSMSQERVLVAGCGSGGGQVALQLAMSGIGKFDLFDHDVLEEENLIRHVCGRRHLGMKKVDALADALLDRNPMIEINRYDVDLLNSPKLTDYIQAASVVVLATDNDPTRYRINQICVDTKTPFVVGRVYTRGIGGEVFSYRPGEGGCLGCLERVLERTPFRDGIREIDLATDEERDKMYGLEIAEIKDSPGLNVDISFITCFHTRFVLDAVARLIPIWPQFMYPIPFNYLVWGNRPVQPFKKNFEFHSVELPPLDACLVCGDVCSD